MLNPGTPIRRWLLWVAAPYALAARLRAWLYGRGWFRQRRLPVPVISVGNLTMGGTGKTPVVIRLAEWLSAEGKRVAILSRGYRRNSTVSKLLVSNGQDILAGPEEAGDEPHLMARRCPKAIVAVGADRYELGRWILDRHSVDCILLDDGFQHLGLHRDVDILLIDATDVDGLGASLPAGRLREPIQAAHRATSVMITRADDPDLVTAALTRLRTVLSRDLIPGQIIFRPEALVSVASDERRSIQWGRGKTALLCSGIGNAASFRMLAEATGLSILDETSYADHHRYTPVDVNDIRGRAKAVRAELVVTTEKDAGKLARLIGADEAIWWALRIGAEVTSGEDRLRELVTHLPAARMTEACA
ncbi:Tetraacyldisaccharide 4'-kinase [Nitrospira sp. KM1]|uniref:tetraacyldisaccharide 4'-kinase n=1 Tax=Nitrospira sp. KM1 TaxID=1936990 RepID=UPI0013A74B0C|nr:tetraacyldisaccharide 4'-kinase [Nitrospira sp. KM1]BCA54247.1 Tetraacyldisaccharide 4'-kinase [Nitrospira sp. KM1]